MVVVVGVAGQCNVISVYSVVQNNVVVVVEGSLEVKLPTILTDEKTEVGRAREEKRRRKKIREEKESEERRCRCTKR